MRNLLKWAGHVERMERLTKEADALKAEGRRRGRPRLRWEEYVTTDLGEGWRTTAIHGSIGNGWWRRQ